MAGYRRDDFHQRHRDGHEQSKACNNHSADDSLDWPGSVPERPMLMYAAQVAAHPMAQATEPTSVTGTRIASPRSIHAAVASPMQRTAVDGV